MRHSREGLNSREKEARLVSAKPQFESTKYDSQKSVNSQKEMRAASRPRDTGYMGSLYKDPNESLHKKALKEDSSRDQLKKTSQSRDNLRSVNHGENSLVHHSIDKHLPRDQSNRQGSTGIDPRLHKVDSNKSGVSHAQNSKKLLNCSGDRSMLKYNHDDKENRQRLANKEK